MPLLDANRSILVLIDLQGKLVHQVYRSAMVLEVAHRLLTFADLFAVPVVLTEQYPKGIGPTEAGLRERFDALACPTFLVPKTAFSCCGDAGFLEALDRARPRLQVCWDGVSGRGAEYRQHALERMAAAGATLTNHESVAFEWARHKDHPGFKALSALLKEGQPQG